MTPENVVELAAAFRAAADRLEPELQGLDNALTIKKPWLGDPYSEWARKRFNEHFVDGENSLVKVVQRMYDECSATYKALSKIAEQYGKTEELNQRKMRKS